MKASAAIVGLVAFAVIAPATRASILKFQNYPETTSIKAPFTDASSGITFQNPQNSAGYFGVDYGGTTANVSDLPGNLLVGNSGELGNGFGLNQNFGFDAVFSTTSGSVVLDVVCLNLNSSPGTITLSGYDSAGTLLGTSTITPTNVATGTYIQTQIAFAPKAGTLKSFSFRTSNLAAGVASVNFAPSPAPEPGAMSLMTILGGYGLLKRRRARQ